MPAGTELDCLMDAGDDEVNVGSKRRKACRRNCFNNPAGLKGLPQSK